VGEVTPITPLVGSSLFKAEITPELEELARTLDLEPRVLLEARRDGVFDGSDQQAVAIVNGFSTACRELETNIASSVARILQPFLADAVRDKAIEALIEQISALTCSSPVPVFRISGPGDLLERVKAQLDTARRTGIEYQVADTLEIRVVADQTVIETQMQAWTARLKEARR